MERTGFFISKNYRIRCLRVSRRLSKILNELSLRRIRIHEDARGTGRSWPSRGRDHQTIQETSLACWCLMALKR